MPPILLVGNNCDRAAERVVSTELGRLAAEELGCGFIEASASTDSNAKEPAFYELVRLLRQQAQHNSERLYIDTPRWKPDGG